MNPTRGATLAGYLPAADVARPMPRPTPNYQPPRLTDLNPVSPPAEDLTGRVFGLVRVGARLEGRPGRPGRWTFVCRCGRAGDATAYDLTAGNRKTCGEAECRSALRREHGVAHP